MKWTTKKDPEVGDERILCKIAWFPRKCTDGITRWLERVDVTQEFKKRTTHCGAYYYYKWVTIEVSPIPTDSGEK